MFRPRALDQRGGLQGFGARVAAPGKEAGDAVEGDAVFIARGSVL